MGKASHEHAKPPRKDYTYDNTKQQTRGTTTRDDKETLPRQVGEGARERGTPSRQGYESRLGSGFEFGCRLRYRSRYLHWVRLFGGVNFAKSNYNVNDQLQECEFPAIFNFGDSNSDTGGLTALYGPAHPPNGITFFGGSAGRFCDGRLVIDFLAGSLGLPYLNAYLNSIGSNFSHGANFASAGATVRPQTTIYFPKDYSPISLNVQSAEFSTFYTRSQVVRNEGGFFESLMPKDDYFASALYTIDIGQNDLTTSYKLNMSNEEVKAIVPDVLSRYAKTVRAVYAQGGRTFWIQNVGPMGCLPYMLDGYPLTEAQVDRFGCAIPINEAAQFYNAKLKELVDQLRKELSLAAFTYVDIYSIKYNLIAHAEELGKAMVFFTL
ncbi:hypothetical protein KSS87_015186 [Heliosperma pusillum]|nr:hypothetical protein KSS87_015186 [Heliosperma pusillum]